jgi:1-acyl-sn-glycerol-3-phosphate acyltransferase
LQQLWYILLRSYVWLGLHVYFRKIIISGNKSLPKGPVIFAANHQNAFLDALMIVCFNNHTTHFLTRADIFKKPFTKWVLSTLNMFPIYRIRDGWKSLSENKSTFDYCHDLFIRNEAVVIFPEGNHGSRRNLRPLSKGFARVAAESLRRQRDLKICIVPVGLNYSDHHSFRSSVSVLFGKPILANSYMNPEGQFESAKLRDELAERLKELITHVGNADYDNVIQQLEYTNPDYLDPAATNIRVSKIENNEEMSAGSSRETRKFWMLWPLHWMSQTIHFLPLLLWGQIRKRIKDPVLLGSIKFGVGIFLFPLFYVLVACLVCWFWGPLMPMGWLMVALASVFFLKK